MLPFAPIVEGPFGYPVPTWYLVVVGDTSVAVLGSRPEFQTPDLQSCFSRGSGASSVGRREHFSKSASRVPSTFILPFLPSYLLIGRGLASPSSLFL